MTTKQRIVSRLFKAVPAPIRRMLPDLSIVIPYYHMVGDSELPYLRFLYKHKNAEAFERDIDYFAAHYNIIGLSDLLKSLTDGRSFRQRVLLLTFDDGFRQIGDVVAPILLRKGVPATVFLNSAFIDGKAFCHRHKASILLDHMDRLGTESMARAVVAILAKRGITPENTTTPLSAAQKGMASVDYNDREVLDLIASEVGIDFGQLLSVFQPYLSAHQVKGLIRDGFSVGAHSIDHPYYQSLAFSEQVYQTVESVRLIRSRFGLSYGVFAFPHSDANIKPDFFQRLSETGLVDATFGNGGIRNGTFRNHFYRFSMDSPTSNPQDMMLLQQVRRIARRS